MCFGRRTAECSESYLFNHTQVFIAPLALDGTERPERGQSGLANDSMVLPQHGLWAGAQEEVQVHQTTNGTAQRGGRTERGKTDRCAA